MLAVVTIGHAQNEATAAEVVRAAQTEIPAAHTPELAQLLRRLHQPEVAPLWRQAIEALDNAREQPVPAREAVGRLLQRVELSSPTEGASIVAQAYKLDRLFDPHAMTGPGTGSGGTTVDGSRDDPPVASSDTRLGSGASAEETGARQCTAVLERDSADSRFLRFGPGTLRAGPGGVGRLRLSGGLLVTRNGEELHRRDSLTEFVTTCSVEDRTGGTATVLMRDSGVLLPATATTITCSVFLLSSDGMRVDAASGTHLLASYPCN